MLMFRARDLIAALAVAAFVYAAFVFVCALDDGCAAIYMVPL
jgi:hypothetical protein